MLFDAAMRLRAGFMLAIVAVLLNLSVPLFGSSWVSRAKAEYEERKRLESRTERLLSALKDGETGQRGFLISGRDVFLEPLFQGNARVDELLHGLQRAFAGDSEIEPRLAQLAIGIAEQRRYFQQTIELRRSEGLEAVSARVTVGEGKQLMDSLRGQLDSILGIFDTRQEALAKEIGDRERLRDMLFSFTAGLDLLLLVGLFFFTFRVIRESQEAERRQQALSDQLSDGMYKLQQRNHEISLLSLMAEALHSSNHQSECEQIIRRFATQLFPQHSGCLYFYHPSQDVLEAAASWGEWPADQDLFEPDQCWAIRRGQSHRVKDAVHELLCPHLDHHPVKHEGYLCVPLLAQGKPLGVMSLAGLADYDRGLAQAFAEQISLGVSNLSLRESLRQQSVVDPLTGLHNRRFLDESFRIELLRATRKQTPMAVVMLDIDHFKRFNDTFGHDAGDLVLRQLALEMKRHVRASDLLCRFGGEEFVLVLGEIEREDAIARCEALRLAVSRLHLRYGGQSLGPLSISLGMACFPVNGDEAEALLLAADAALYRAKASGRNRLCLFEDSEENEAEPAANSEPV